MVSVGTEGGTPAGQGPEAGCWCLGRGGPAAEGPCAPRGQRGPRRPLRVPSSLSGDNRGRSGGAVLRVPAGREGRPGGAAQRGCEERQDVPGRPGTGATPAACRRGSPAASCVGHGRTRVHGTQPGSRPHGHRVLPTAGTGDAGLGSSLATGLVPSALRKRRWA